MSKAETGEFNIAIVSDLHFRQDKHGNWKKSRISDEQFATIFDEGDILCVCGDWTQDARVEEAKKAAEHFKDSPIPIIGVLGNHDRNIDHPTIVEEILFDKAGIMILHGDVYSVTTETNQTLSITGVTGYTQYVSPGKLGPNRVSQEEFDEMIELDYELLEDGIENLNGSTNIVLLHFPPIESYYDPLSLPRESLTIPNLISQNKQKINIVAFGDRHSDPEPELTDRTFKFSSFNAAQKPIFIKVTSQDPVITAI